MAKNKQLAPHLPETQLFTPSVLRKMITKHGQVILKPVFGYGGSGVIQVSPYGNNRYEIHIEKKKTVIQGFRESSQYIKRIIGSRNYMVQKRIHLAEIYNRPFDIRVIIQRKKKNPGSWKVTGKLAKVAGKGYIVTNITRTHGTLLTVKTAIQRSLEHLSSQRILSKIIKISLLSAHCLTPRYPNHRIYGLDLGLDQNGHIWIIEANLSPAMSHFLKIKDKTMYRRIMEYKKG